MRNKKLCSYHAENMKHFKDLACYYKFIDYKKYDIYQKRYRYHQNELKECNRIMALKIDENGVENYYRIPSDIRKIINVEDLKTNWEIHSMDYKELFRIKPKDEIPPIDNPIFVDVEEAKQWLQPDEPVIVLPSSKEEYAKAYPIQVLLWHEIVNDFILEEPIVVTYAPLCNISYIYKREVKNQIYEFGSSGILRFSCTLMYDIETESLWEVMTGNCIVGDLTGEKLTAIPSNTVPFKTFYETNPEGLVILSSETGYSFRYGINPYALYDEAKSPFFYKNNIDERYPAMERVVGIKKDSVKKAYPYSIIKKLRVIEDVIEDKELVIFYQEDMISPLNKPIVSEGKKVGVTGVFSPYINGRKINFYSNNNKIFDKETNSEWNLLGYALNGSLQGERLKMLVHSDPFWFAWSACYPDTEVYV